MEKGEFKLKKGFTIIEVLLVLAIAGLIFLMIFLAWPALSRTQRDARRRDDIALFLKEVKDYQTNNRGALPTGQGTITRGTKSDTDWSGFYHDYLEESFGDPNGVDYVLNVANCASGKTAGQECDNILTDSSEFSGNMMIFKAATCDGSRAVVSNNPRKIAIQYKLEGGGVYCANT